MASRAGHRASRSFRATVLPMGAPPFSPATDSNRRVVDVSPRVGRYCKGENTAATIVRKDAGFESREPTFPKVSCMGKIKMKPQWVKPSKQVGADKAVKDNNKMPKLRKLMPGRYQRNKSPEEAAAAVQGEEDNKVYPSLGQIKRYTSGSYDAKYGTMFVEEGPIVAKSGPLVLEGFPKAVTKKEEEESGINIWKRRSIPPWTWSRRRWRDLSRESPSPSDRGLKRVPTI